MFYVFSCLTVTDFKLVFLLLKFLNVQNVSSSLTQFCLRFLSVSQYTNESVYTEEAAAWSFAVLFSGCLMTQYWLLSSFHSLYKSQLELIRVKCWSPCTVLCFVSVQILWFRRAVLGGLTTCTVLNILWWAHYSLTVWLIKFLINSLTTSRPPYL